MANTTLCGRRAARYSSAMTDTSNPRPAAPPIVWTIAGTDPSGGAGIPADLLTLHDLGCHGASVVTAILAQNTLGVVRIEPASALIVRAQLTALADDLPPAAVKIGMLSRAEIVRAVAETLAGVSAPAVCDPVLASTGGAALLDTTGRGALVSELLPRLAVLTPNAPEAEILTGQRIASPDDVRRAADRLLAMGPRAVVLKGGHFGGSDARDYFSDGRETFWMASPRQAIPRHGTGCVFSSALAAGLAQGVSLADAAMRAKAYVNQGFRLGAALGHGRPPLAHAGEPGDPRDWPLRIPA